MSAAAARPEHVPEWMEVEPQADGVVYTWPLLPRNPLLIGFFLVLGASLTLPGPFLLAADFFGGAAGVWPYGAALSVFTVATARFFLVALLGRGRLALSPSALDYEVLLLGRSLRADRRRVPRAKLVGLRVTDPSHQGLLVARDDGKPFHIKVPVGAGALSRRELELLRDRWLLDLGR